MEQRKLIKSAYFLQVCQLGLFQLNMAPEVKNIPVLLILSVLLSHLAIQTYGMLLLCGVFHLF